MAQKPAETVELCLDMELLRIAQPHVLLVGPKSATRVLLDAIRPALHPPVVEGFDEAARLPRDGTLILRNVESLNQRRLQELFTWMQSSAARVVTICESPLYTRVVNGSFPSDLYYRLNVLTLAAGKPEGIHEEAAVVSARGRRGDCHPFPYERRTAPTQDQIAQRAYELYEARGRGKGGEQDDWLQAEHELWRQRAAPWLPSESHS